MPFIQALGKWLRVLGACLALLAIGWIIAQHALGLQLLAVQTGSMRPAFKPGDALIIRPASASSLRVGQIVSYRSSRNENELITHRLVVVGSRGFQTKGDRLHSPDPAVRNSLLVGKVTTILPGLGRSLNWLRSWPGLISCVYLPSLAIGISELFRLEHHYRRLQPYYLH